jgi:hypothetical protein
MEHQSRRVRHNSRRRTLAVLDKRHVTPRMLRIVLGGEDFEDFTTPSADDHIKLYVPGEGGDLEARDFTPRHFDAEAKKLTIDIALHLAGPTIRWTEQAQIGDAVEISGPRGSLMIADDFDWWLLIGDETALPSIGRRVEDMAEGVRIITPRGGHRSGRGTGVRHASRPPSHLGSSPPCRRHHCPAGAEAAEEDRIAAGRRFRVDCGGGQGRARRTKSYGRRQTSSAAMAPGIGVSDRRPSGRLRSAGELAPFGGMTTYLDDIALTPRRSLRHIKIYR